MVVRCGAVVEGPVLNQARHDLHFVAVRRVRRRRFGIYYLPAMKALQIYLLVLASLFFYGYGQPELLPMLAVRCWERF
jgi:hypothetical protein